MQQIDALDHFEDLTEIGYHLADLPLEPRLGKVVLYSIVLKCLDPVLTIVCALAYKDPCKFHQYSSKNLVDFVVDLQNQMLIKVRYTVHVYTTTDDIDICNDHCPQIFIHLLVIVNFTKINN